MTHTDYTKLILNIEDTNIYFNENCLKIVNIKLYFVHFSSIVHEN